MYNLYSSVVQGTLTMSDFMEKYKNIWKKQYISGKIRKYTKKLMAKYTEAYGIDFKDVENKWKI